ncbi:MAG: PLP-dependent transferase [Deltaproteobacteria bacterium]|nr:MAG: PLP-dependent transferase [Deltaproteobacteria bacterium]
MSDDGRIETRCIHGGQQHEPTTGAVMQPVFQTSTYAQPWPAKHTGYEYARTQNPTREALERCIASLEGATEAVCFGSGLAATSTVIQALGSGAKVVCGDDLYGGTYRVFTRVFAKFGVEFSFVDLANADLEEAIPEDTDLVWLESPTNPLLKITDIRKVAERAKQVGATLAVDNTFATPVFQRPLELGADLVVHSTTKYLNGHSDVVGGVVATADPAWAEQLRFLQNAVGAVPGPWDTWLTLRGLKTLAVRMERHQANARRVVEWLENNPKVTRIHYPFREEDPGYAIASSQMSGFGGMVSFVLDCTLEQAEKFCASTKVFTLAESLGGVESLLELPASMTHASVPPEIREELGLADGLIRLSCGIEHADDLIADLEQALAAALQ